VKLLIDHCVSKRTSDFLVSIGHEVTLLKELGLETLDDPEILELAATRDEVLITEDRGFGNVVKYPPSSHQGAIVLIIRTRNRKGLHEALRQFLQNNDRERLRQKLVVINEQLARVRK